MNKYEELIKIFSNVLKKSVDYRIAYIHGVGYASVIGLYKKSENLNISMKIEEVFETPEEMADSLLQNWRWQWLYENRKSLRKKDYESICNLDNDIPMSLKKEYMNCIHNFQEKIWIVLHSGD